MNPDHVETGGLNLNLTGAPVPKDIVTPDKTPPVTTGGLDLTLVSNDPSKDIGTLQDDRFKSRINPNEYTPYISYGIDDNEGLDVARADAQSWWAKGAGFLYQSVVGEVLGGAIQGFGALYELGIGQWTKDNADFNNWAIELGSALQEHAQHAAPIYQRNPDKSFQFGDWGYMFQNGVSIASTLSLLIPGMAAVKGASFIGRMAGLSGKVGQLGKQLLKTGITASVMRNAENFRESLDVTNKTRLAAQEQFKDMSNEEFSEWLTTEGGKEFVNSGQDLNKSAAADFVAAQAGWRSYTVNSMNIVFDFAQASLLFKGLAPATRSGKSWLFTPKEVLAASGKTLSFGQKAARAVVPYLMPFAAQANEGVEEMVNFIGGQEGEVYGKRLLGEKVDSLDKRLKAYMGNEKMYEAGMWGIAGGVAFAGIANKISGQGKNKKLMIAQRVGEINNRMAILENGQQAIDQITQDFNDGKIDQEYAQELIGETKSAISFHLGLNAAATGNVDILLEQMQSPEMREKLADAFNTPGVGVGSVEDVDKTVANATRDILEAERLYKAHYATLFNKTGISSTALQSALQSSLNASHEVFRHQKAVEKLGNQIAEEQASPAVALEAEQTNYQQTIQSDSLEVASIVIESMLNDKAKPLPAFLQQSLKNKLAKIKEEKAAIDSTITGTRAKTTNSEKLIQLNAQRYLREGYQSAFSERVGEIQTKENLQKLEEDIKAEETAKAEEALTKRKEELQAKIDAGTMTVEALEMLKANSTKEDKQWIDVMLKDLKAKEKLNKETTKAEEERKKRDGTTTEVEETLPVDNTALSNELGAFKEEYDREVAQIDSSTTDIDKKKKALSKFRKLLAANGFKEGGAALTDIDNRIAALEAPVAEATAVPEPKVTPAPEVTETTPVIEELDLRNELQSNYDSFAYEVEAALFKNTPEARIAELKLLIKDVKKIWKLEDSSVTITYLNQLIEKEEGLTPEVIETVETINTSAVESVVTETSNDNLQPEVVEDLSSFIDDILAIEVPVTEDTIFEEEKVGQEDAVITQSIEASLPVEDESVSLEVLPVEEEVAAVEVISTEEVSPSTQESKTPEQTRPPFKRYYNDEGVEVNVAGRPVNPTGLTVNDKNSKGIAESYRSPTMELSFVAKRADGEVAINGEPVVEYEVRVDTAHSTGYKRNNTLTKSFATEAEARAWAQKLIDKDLEKLARQEAKEKLEEKVEVAPALEGDSSAANLFIPALMGTTNYTEKEPGIYETTSQEVDDAFNLMQELSKNPEAEIELEVLDSTEFGADPTDWASAIIPITYQGKVVGYIPTPAGVQKGIKQFEDNEAVVTMLKNQLAGVIKLRQELLKNPNKVYTTKLKRFTSGTLVTSKTLRNPLDVLVGDFKLYYVDPRQDGSKFTSLVTYDSPLTFYQNSDKAGYYNHDGSYKRGGIYLLINGLNSTEGFASQEALQTKIPIRLQVATLQPNDVNVLASLIDKTLLLLADDKLDFTANEALNNLREEISNITAYQSTNQEKNGNIPKPTFKIHKDRIEFLFDNDTKLMRIYHNNGNPSVRVFEFKGKKNEYESRQEFNEAVGQPITDTINSKKQASQYKAAIKKALAYKQYNIKFGDLKEGKTTPQKLMEEGKLLTNMGVILGQNGEKLSNFTAKPVQNPKEVGGKNGNLVLSVDTRVNVKEVVQEETAEKIVETPEITAPKTLEEIVDSNWKKFLDAYLKQNPLFFFHDNEYYETLVEKEDITAKVIAREKKAGNIIPLTSENYDEAFRTNSPDNLMEKNGRIGEFPDKDAWYTHRSLLTNPPSMDIELGVKELSLPVTEDSFDGDKDVQKLARAIQEQLGYEIFNPEQNVEEQTEEKIVVEPVETPQIPSPETSVHVEEIKEEDLDDIFGKEEWEDDVDDFDAYTMMADETVNFETAQPEQRQANWKRMFGDNVELDTNVEGLIYYKGKWAFGLFHRAMASVSKLAPRGTEYHEAFHVTMHLYLKEKAREAIYEEARKRWPKLANATNRQLEEKLADDFKAYAALKEKGYKTKTGGIIQRFFDRLLYYINNILNKALGRTSIDNLYRGINSGAFNYKPSADMIEYAAKIGYTEEVADLDTVFTPQELDSYTNYLSLIVYEHMGRYPHITNKDIKENPNKYSPRQVALAHLKRHGRNLQAKGDIEAAKHVAKIITYLGNEETGLWARVKNDIKHKLNFEIAYDENIEAQFSGSAALEKKWDDRAAFASSSKESFDADLKRIIMTTYKLTDANFEVDENGNKIFTNKDTSNPAKLPTGLDFNKVYNFLQTQMANSVNADEMLDRLRAMADSEPSLALLHEKISNNPLYRAKWFVNFNKANMRARHHRLTADGTGFNVKSDVSNKSYALADTWTNNLQILIDETNRKKGNEHFTPEKVEAMSSELSKIETMFKEGVNLAEASQILSEVAADLGMNLPAVVISKLVNNPSINKGNPDLTLKELVYFPLNRTLSTIKKNIAQGKAIVFNEYGRINELASYASYYMFDTTESSYYNTSGNLVFSYAKHSFLSDFYDKIERVFNPYNINKEQAQADLLGTLTEYANDPSMNHSNWLWGERGLLTGTKENPGLNLDNLANFKFFKSDGLKNINTRFGAGYADLAEQDWDIQVMLDYLTTTDTKGNTIGIPSLIQSDSGNIWLMQSQRFRYETKDGKILKGSPLHTALKNTLRQEMARMRQAQQLLLNEEGTAKELSEEVKVALELNYHYKKLDKQGNPIVLDKGRPVGRVFQFHNMNFVDVNGNYRDLNATLEEAGFMPNGVLDFNLFNSNANDILEMFIEDFVDAQVKEGADKYGKYKAILEESTSGKSKLLGRYNSFQDFIGEMMLNTYVAYVEHNNFFNGTISELKDVKDTNKRAKHQSSPKQVADTGFRGATYKAITIKDVELQSSFFSNIAEEVAEKFKQENPKLNDLAIDITKLEKEDTANYNELEKLVDYVVSGYKYTNTADAQGYLTLSRYKAILKDYGRWNAGYEAVFNKLENNQELNTEELKFVLQVLKPFYYGRNFDPVLQKMRSRQIKTSLLPLIPQLYKGTELEKIVDYMNANEVGEMYFQSASKVGSGYLSNIADKTGKLIDNFESVLSPVTYLNSNWGLQLDVPDHIKDEKNKLGVQITKVVFANLSNDAIYALGDTTLTGKEIRQQFFDVLSANIEEDSQALLERIGAVLNENGQYELQDVTKIHDILFEELEARGLADNFKEAIALIKTADGKTTFNMPLFINNMASKYQSILLSLFTNSVTNQKAPGGHMVLAANTFITNISSDTEVTGIEYHAEVQERVKSGNFKLNYTHYVDGNYIVAEALLPAWSKKFFDENGERISINELPEEVRTMIGYRIPTESKYSTVVFKVIGFLPEGAGSTIVMPEELVTQTGWDFDVDSLYVMQKEFNKTKEGKFVVPEFDNTKTVSANNREARNNHIFDIFKSILTNPFHYRDVVNPGKFTDPKNLKDKQEKLLGINANNLNPNTRGGQDFFRAANIAGRALKGMAANANGIFPVLQNIDAELRADLAFQFKYELGDVYTKEKLEALYGKDVKFENDTAIVTHRMIGQTPTGQYVNVDGQVITDHAAQMLAMILDIVKEGLPYNINTYTFDTYMMMLGTGVNIDHAGQFIRQPILNALATKALNNQSILGSSSGKEIEETKRDYQTKLFKTLVKSGAIEKQVAVDKGLATFRDGELVWNNKKLYLKRDETGVLLGYNPDNKVSWSIKELDGLIANSNIGKSNAYIKEQGFRVWNELSDKEKAAFFQQQLLVLERFISYKKAGEALADINKVLNTDKNGPGPSFTVGDVWQENYKNAENYAFDSESYVNNKGQTKKRKLGARLIIAKDGSYTPVVSAVFKDDSVYSPYRAYEKHSNDRAVEVFGSLFIERTRGYLYAKAVLYDFLEKRPSEKTDKTLDKFLKSGLLNFVDAFTSIDKAKVLGIGVEVNTNKDVTLEEFNQLSTANQLFIVKQKFPELYGLDSSHFLNYLTPKIDSSSIDRYKMHMIHYNKPKASDGIDNYLDKSFELMLNSENDFVRTLAENLVSYEFASTGMNYGKNSFSTNIPTSYLVNEQGINLGNVMRTIDANFRADPVAFRDKFPNFVEQFYQNNWNNTEIVPRVQSRYKRDAEGKNTEETVDDTPDWSELTSTSGVVIVSKEALRKESRQLQKSPYLLVSKREGEEFITILLKKYSFDNEEMNDINNDKAHANFYYYPVNKLGGSTLGTEFTTQSVLPENNTLFTEPVYKELVDSYLSGDRKFLLISQEIANQIATDLNQRKCT